MKTTKRQSAILPQAKSLRSTSERRTPNEKPILILVRPNADMDEVAKAIQALRVKYGHAT